MNTTDKLAEALRLAREWFRHEEAGEGPQADAVIKAADEALAAHDAEQAQEAQQAQQAAGQEQDERAAFEAWYEGNALPGEADWFRRDSMGEYKWSDTAACWEGWQAAMAHAREAMEAVPVPRTWDFATSRHSWVTSQDFDDYRAAVLRALGGK